MDIADYANGSPPSARISQLVGYFREERPKTAIDSNRRAVVQILAFGTVERLENDDFLGRLLLLGIVSAAEAYIRSILVSCIELCPLAQASAAQKNINLGGVLWHGRSGFSRSAFDHTSFASKEQLVTACKDFIKFKLNDAVFMTPLEQFDIVCQLRHAIVHCDGILPGKNAIQLAVPRFNLPARIVIRYEHLQDAAAVVNTLVQTLNRELFAELCKRWAIDWRTRPDWNPDPRHETAMFARIWSAFHSSDELRQRAGRSLIRRSRCMTAVKALYGL